MYEFCNLGHSLHCVHSVRHMAVHYQAFIPNLRLKYSNRADCMLAQASQIDCCDRVVNSPQEASDKPLFYSSLRTQFTNYKQQRSSPRRASVVFNPA